MAFQVSPGVQVKEIDLTSLIPAVSATRAGFCGQFNWGPVEQITTINSVNQLREIFATPDNQKLREKDRLKEEHIKLQYYKENNRLIRQQKEIELKMKTFDRNKKPPYPRKTCWKCRASCGGICVEHGG